MRATVRKWGNSLALRIPSGLAEGARLRDGVEVDIALEGDRLIVAPIPVPEVSLDALIAGITPENVHGEQFADGARGTEAW
ncbi:MAG: AbrB/MazE/SpoVT family DNA-binding domain-containing protein [Gemmatimonadaceae bacterium]